MRSSNRLCPKPLALCAAWMPLAAALSLVSAPALPAAWNPGRQCAISNIAIRIDSPDAAAPQVHLRAPNGVERHWDLRILPAGTEVFLWDTEARVAEWSAQGRVSPAEARAWLHDCDDGHYLGLRVSLHPFDTAYDGSHLLVSRLIESLRVVQVPTDFERDPFEAFAQAAGVNAADEQGGSWAAHLQRAGIGAMAKAPRTPHAPWPDGLTVFASGAFASSHGAQQQELLMRLRTTAWHAPSLSLPVPVLKLIALTRASVHPSFALAQLPLTFFDDVPWLHQALTHGTVQDGLPVFCVAQDPIDIKTYICRWLPELPGWQPSALYRRLYHALCQDAAAAAEARSEET